MRELFWPTIDVLAAVAAIVGAAWYFRRLTRRERPATKPG
jgi:hypothetical protein